MNDIPGLSRSLADAGKRVDSWDDAGGQLVVVASSNVARDRAGAYSEAVQPVDDKVLQVADRWHLIANMRESIERLLLRQHAKLREAARTLSEAIRTEGHPVTANSLACRRSGEVHHAMRATNASWIGRRSHSAHSGIGNSSGRSSM